MSTLLLAAQSAVLLCLAAGFLPAWAQTMETAPASVKPATPAAKASASAARASTSAAKAPAQAAKPAASAAKSAASAAKPAKPGDKPVAKSAPATAVVPVPVQVAPDTIGPTATRMQRCQAELVGVAGKDRSRILRECLVYRAEGERLLARDCSRQFRSLPAGHGTDKTTFQKQCLATALQVSHKELPRRPARPVSASTNSAPTVAAPAATPVANKE